MTDTPQLVVGLMSGTSLDGMDAAVVRIAGPTSIELVGFAHRAYHAAERKRIEAVLRGRAIADAARLHVALAEWAAEAVDAALARSHVRADALAAIAFPGQTVWHEPPTVSFQLGEPAVLAERFGVRIVHNFRSRDVAAGGEGAPLVPMADALCFGAPDHPRILLNIGGMANVTWVRRRADLGSVVAADTGPGMAIIDGIARLVDPALPFDQDARLGNAGVVNSPVVGELLGHEFFASSPPRSTGRELFGEAYALALHRRVPGSDGVRTAIELTVESIARCCEQHLPPAPEVVAAGGGTHHPLVMRLLSERLAAGGRELRRFDELFFAADAKEAAAFALLGWLTVHGQPGNLPGATGARGPRVLGSVTPA